MRIVKILGWTLFILLSVLALAFGIFWYVLKPDYQGEKQLAGLSGEVRVHFDSYGIPHIYGENQKDAFTALGYVHAQDRLWQMELLRRIGKGGISEVFGRDFIGTDKFFLALGIDDASEQTVAGLDKNLPSVQLSQAYLNGINTFIEEGPTPVEFLMTGIEKEAFTLKDVYNTMGYMAFSFAMAHKTDPLLTKIRDSLGAKYLIDLQVHSDTSTVWIPTYDPDNDHQGQVSKTKRSQSWDARMKDSIFWNSKMSDIEGENFSQAVSRRKNSLKEKLSAGVLESLASLSIPQFEGSNSWVLAPPKTKRGKVIFANDPHIGFSQPSVWYEAHVSTPDYEKYGYHLAGVPFPLLGHDRNLAYGMTMFENDDVDFYYEQPHPADTNRYKNRSEWVDYEVVSESIKVKDSSEVDFAYKKTVHGPVLNGIADQIDGERPVSMWWAYTQLDNKVMEALYGMSHAKNIDEFRNVLPSIHAPGLNIMYGDSEGNVAWWATARLYRIPDSLNTKIVYDLGKGLPADREYLTFAENPTAINPPWNYVYSANNQPDSIAGMLYPGYYLPENRAKRIETLLEAKDDWDARSVRAMMNDVTSPINPVVLRNLLKDIDTKKLSGNQLQGLDKLQRWQGDYPLNSIEATIYHHWMYRLLVDTFKDELGPYLFDDLLDTHLVKRLIAPLSTNETSVWWDDVGTKEQLETKSDIINKSFRKAWEALENSLGENYLDWTWDRVHTLEHGHPMGQVEALRPFFNVGPFPATGTREVINNMAFPYTEDQFYEVSSGPSTRRVIDFSDVENSMSILPTGQSGNIFSPYYKDQAEMYANGEFRKMMMNQEEIMETSESVLTFRPLDE